MNSWTQPFGDKRLGPFYMWPVAYLITKIFYLPIRVVYNTKKTNYDTYRQTGTEMGERMKNRDNEFFIEEELDELVREENKEALKDQLSRILACPCCLNGFKHCRKYLQIIYRGGDCSDTVSGNRRSCDQCDLWRFGAGRALCRLCRV